MQISCRCAVSACVCERVVSLVDRKSMCNSDFVVFIYLSPFRLVLSPSWPLSARTSDGEWLLLFLMCTPKRSGIGA